MSYIDVLPLAEMKNYLRIDDSQNETDTEITSMIKSALGYIEKHTNILVYARDKTYLLTDGSSRVYDFPINSVVSPATSSEYTATTKTYYTNYTLNDEDATLTLNVGYVSNVPTELIDLAKVMVKIMYFEQESQQSFREMLPQWAKEILETNRRFIV